MRPRRYHARKKQRTPWWLTPQQRRELCNRRRLARLVTQQAGIPHQADHTGHKLGSTLAPTAVFQSNAIRIVLPAAAR